MSLHLSRCQDVIPIPDHSQSSSPMRSLVYQANPPHGAFFKHGMWVELDTGRWVSSELV